MDAINIVLMMITSNATKILGLASVILDVASLGALALAALSVNNEITGALLKCNRTRGQLFEE
jgi:hypothetical protein